jgi:hypothetical protein
LKRAAAALRDLGLSLERVEIDNDGRIILVPGKPANDDDGRGNGGGPADEWRVA